MYRKKGGWEYLCDIPQDIYDWQLAPRPFYLELEQDKWGLKQGEHVFVIRTSDRYPHYGAIQTFTGQILRLRHVGNRILQGQSGYDSPNYLDDHWEIIDTVTINMPFDVRYTYGFRYYDYRWGIMLSGMEDISGVPNRFASRYAWWTGKNDTVYQDTDESDHNWANFGWGALSGWPINRGFTSWWQGQSENGYYEWPFKGIIYPHPTTEWVWTYLEEGTPPHAPYFHSNYTGNYPWFRGSYVNGQIIVALHSGWGETLGGPYLDEGIWTLQGYTNWTKIAEWNDATLEGGFGRHNSSWQLPLIENSEFDFGAYSAAPIFENLGQCYVKRYSDKSIWKSNFYGINTFNIVSRPLKELQVSEDMPLYADYYCSAPPLTGNEDWNNLMVIFGGIHIDS
jgi:hypothetical protein